MSPNAAEHRPENETPSNGSVAAATPTDADGGGAERGILAGQAVELLRELIRNACVNDGTAASGHEERSVKTLERFFAGSGIDHEIVEPAPGRQSLIARIPGRDPGAPSLALVGHLDVVPADASAWRHDPFGGELIGDEIWGRGAVDMLTLTASMAVVARLAASPEHRPEGDLVFAAVADEEAGGTYGVKWIVEHRPELLDVDAGLTEQGGVHMYRQPSAHPPLTLGVGEKGSAPRRLRITGVPGHGSVPFGSRNAAGIAAEVILHLLQHPAPPQSLPYWQNFVQALRLSGDVEARLLDPERLDGALEALGDLRALGHALTRMTVSPNIVVAGDKRNTIPGSALIELDIRVIPGQTSDDVDRFLRESLAPWGEAVAVEGDAFTPASLSSSDTDLYRRIVEEFRRVYPGAVPAAIIGPGGSDGRFLRARGAEVYGFGLFSDAIDLGAFRRRLHANDERIDLRSVALTVEALRNVVLG